jgi:hypothetical protein
MFNPTKKNKIQKQKIQTCTKQVWELGLDLVLIEGQFASVGRFFSFKC